LTERDWENAVQGLGNPLSTRFYSDKEDSDHRLFITKSNEKELVIAIFAGNLFLRIFKITG